ncbi:MAG: pyrF [Caulobacteraceae bacterium]|nr:pyrF [Caulobacteraceae bacterium]
MRNLPPDVARRLILALDLADLGRAREMVRRLDGVVSFYKIGFWLAFQRGADALIDELVASGKDVFLDYKLHDIGETVRAGVASVASRGAKFITVHAEPQVMAAAVEGRGDSRLQILGVTVLTSLDDAALSELGYASSAVDLVAKRVRQAAASGVDGVIASASDDPDALRAQAAAPNLLVVTPGIRPAGAALGDQKRAATPAAAMARGADYLVVGRPILQAPDPAAAAEAIIAEMRGA